MKNFHLNHYEKAFANWLLDNRIPYVAVDEQKRAALGRSNLKSFDYLLYPANQKIIIAEIKGRLFKGKSIGKLSGMQSWVSTDDIDGLFAWQQVFGQTHAAALIFVYHIENVDVDFDGKQIYEYDGRNYFFYAVFIDDYIKIMKLRSPRWKTVHLPVKGFRQIAHQMQNIF
jgi:hypothetical protein